jgi:hypothetical protein
MFWRKRNVSVSVATGYTQQDMEECEMRVEEK